MTHDSPEGEGAHDQIFSAIKSVALTLTTFAARPNTLPEGV